MATQREKSRRVRQAAGMVDLAAAALSDEQAASVQEELELRGGLRCRGCLRRIGIGLRLKSIDPRSPDRPVVTLAACNRQDCDFAITAREGATVIEMIEFAWLDDAGLEARAAQVPGIKAVSGPTVKTAAA